MPLPVTLGGSRRPRAAALQGSHLPSTVRPSPSSLAAAAAGRQDGSERKVLRYPGASVALAQHSSKDCRPRSPCRAALALRRLGRRQPPSAHPAFCASRPRCTHAQLARSPGPTAPFCLHAHACTPCPGRLKQAEPYRLHPPFYAPITSPPRRAAPLVNLPHLMLSRPIPAPDNPPQPNTPPPTSTLSPPLAPTDRHIPCHCPGGLPGLQHLPPAEADQAVLRAQAVSGARTAHMSCCGRAMWTGWQLQLLERESVHGYRDVWVCVCVVWTSCACVLSMCGWVGQG